MAAPTYTLDLQPAQQSIVDYFEDTFDCDVFPGGFLDTEKADQYTDGSVKPFIVLWFRSLRRSSARKGTRSFAGPRLDAYTSGFDAVCVAANPEHAQSLINYVTDMVVGLKFENTGVVNLDGALWDATRPITDSKSKPTRWAATQRFSFGAFQTRVPPSV